MNAAKAFAKINLALVVGPKRPDGRHEVVTVMQRIELHDLLELEPADGLVVEGFRDDTIVHASLELLAAAAGVQPGWRVRIHKSIPVAAGLGGGSSDAATALRLANATLQEPLAPEELHRLGARIGADVPFFLSSGPQLGTGDGTELVPVELPIDYLVVLVCPDGMAKESTAAVYAAFDARDAAGGFEGREKRLRHALASVRHAPDLAGLPSNDLASSPVERELETVGAFRADVSGAGPTVYGLFEDESGASLAAASLAHVGRTIVTRPVGAGDLPRVAR